MASFPLFSKRVVACLFVLLALTGPGSAQSGRCLMKGYVVGEHDWPGLKNATVELTGDPENERLASIKMSVQTDENGEYTMREIPYGEYTLRVSAQGYRTYEIPIYMLSDTTTQLHVRLKKSS